MKYEKICTKNACKCDNPCYKPDYKHIGYLDRLPLYWSSTLGYARADHNIGMLIRLNHVQLKDAKLLFPQSTIDKILEGKK